jgi:hypothetical protein
MRKLIIGCFAAAALGSVSVPAAARSHVDVFVGFAPPPARFEVVPAPRGGFVWVPGHWGWVRGAYVWEAGHWIRHRPGYVYAPARWVFADGRWGYHRGAWVVVRPAWHPTGYW